MLTIYMFADVQERPVASRRWRVVPIAVVVTATLAHLSPANVKSDTRRAPVHQPDGRGSLQQDSGTFENDAVDIVDLDLTEMLNTTVGVGAVGATTLRDVPAVVEVLTAEQIRTLAVRDLRELVLYMTSVYERADALIPAAYHSLRIGGGPAAHRILLVVDEHMQLDEVYEMLRPYHIPVDCIERVELLRGPASVLYGSGAMQAVLRVVTKRGTTNLVGGTILVDPVGEGGDVSAHASGALQMLGHPLKVRVDIQARQSEKRRSEVLDDLGESAWHNQRVRNAASLATVTYRGFYLRLQQELLRASMLGMADSAAFKAKWSRTAMYAGEMGYELEGTHGKLAARLGLEHRPRRLDVGRLPPFPVAGRATHENATDVFLDTLAVHADTYAVRHFSHGSVSVGLSVRHARSTRLEMRYQNDGALHNMSFPDGMQGSFEDASAFGTGSVRIADTLSIQAGGRLNLFRVRLQRYGDLFNEEEARPPISMHPMGQLAIVWSLGDASVVKCLYGRSYRNPSILELYGTVGPYLKANPTLQPEIQSTWSAVIDTAISRDLALRVDGYYGSNADAILFESAGPFVSHIVNVPFNVVSYGANASLRWTLLSRVDVSASVTLQEARVDDSGYEYIERATPRYLGSLRLHVRVFDVRSLRVTPSIRLCGPRSGGEADAVVDLAALWDVYPGVTLTIAGRNLFDRNSHLPYDTGLETAYLRRSSALRLAISAEF